jgi:hypothetical protein
LRGRALGRLRSCLALAGLSAALLAMTAAPALAQDGFDLKFRVAASNGYELTVGGYGATTFVKASKPDRSNSQAAAWSTYIARGHASPTAIDADFGDLGSAAMRFHPSGPARDGKRHRGCLGPDHYTIRSGVFVGSLRFHGEGGYTSADVRRVRGKEITPRQLLCRDIFAEQIGSERTHARGVEPKVTRFQAYMRSGLTATAFSATARQGGTVFLAQSEQSIGPLAIYRGAIVHAPSATFAFDSALGFAGVTPPAPFSGSASFQRGPEGRKDWTGSLAVSFPGAADVPLTGPKFRTQLTGSW